MAGRLLAETLAMANGIHAAIRPAGGPDMRQQAQMLADVVKCNDA